MIKQYNGLGGYSSDGIPICHYINRKLICRSFCKICNCEQVFVFQPLLNKWKCDKCSSFYYIDELKER